MEIEEIIDLLGEVRNSKYVVKGTLKGASTMAKGFKCYTTQVVDAQCRSSTMLSKDPWSVYPRAQGGNQEQH